ncbi:hypothetical protein [uncultured Desulfobulbus sp.]|uniref:hypothetical protein n=1 Tax=uncultured Desulfobulbus sp. TaxID=239745 RepID=UPI0029C6569E|nr:hypothetical protein [uncultured Desulfobulbus sp.]
MITMLPKREDPVPAVEIIKKIISLMATCLGLAIILIGLKYAMDIFELIFTILKSPAYLTGPIQQMAESIGGRAFDLKLESRSVPLANIMALMVYCSGALLSAWLTLALMHTGAKIVSLTAGDRSAVKQLLQSAFGNSLQPKTTTENDKTQPRG